MYHHKQNKWYPKGFNFPISKLHSILAVANLLAHNNKSQICYCGQISLQSAAVNCSFSDNLTPLGVTFILLAMVHILQDWGRICLLYREKIFCCFYSIFEYFAQFSAPKVKQSKKFSTTILGSK